MRRRLFLIINIFNASSVIAVLLTTGYFLGADKMFTVSTRLTAMMLACGAVVFGILAVDSLFRDTYDTATSDVAAALPVNGSTRYLTKLWALCLMHILPMIVWAGAEAIFLDLYCTGEDQIYFQLYEAEGGAALFRMVVGATIIFDTVEVLVLSCTGTGWVSLPVIGTLLATVLWFPYFFDRRFEWSASFGNNVYGSLEAIADEISFYEVCIACAVLLAVAGIVYANRDARGIGSQIASAGAKEFLVCMFLMVALSFGLFHRYAIVWTVAAAAVWLAGHAIFRGNERRFLAWSGMFLGALVTALLVVHIGFRVNRGLAKPEEEQQEYIGNAVIGYSLDRGDHPGVIYGQKILDGNGRDVKHSADDLRKFETIIREFVKTREGSTGFLASAFGLRELPKYKCLLCFGVNRFAGEEDNVLTTSPWFEIPLTEAELEELALRLADAGFVINIGG